MANIVLFENIHPSAREVFKQAGLTNIVSHAIALPPDDLRAALKDADIVGIRSRTNLDAGLLNDFSNIRVIGCFCIGTNQVALDVAAQKGIPVFNAPFSNTRSVAELVLGEAILLLRRIPEKNDRVHSGHWDKTATGAFEARGKTLGIIGYGNIGSQVSTLAESLGMRVIYHDIEAKLPLGNARAALSLNQLLEEADVITLHVPGGSGTANMINAERLSRTKKGAIIINASRGTVVDIEALRDAIVSGHIAGAALDVFPVEPKGPNEPLQSPLVGLPNVILTPHIGGSTQESQENIGREVAEKLVRYWLSGTTKGAVNFPELPYLAPNGETRVLHIHRNAPGAVSALNNTLAEKGLNIVSQTLQTRGQLGYVLTDVDGPVGDDVLALLRGHPATIRVERVSLQ